MGNKGGEQIQLWEHRTSHHDTIQEYENYPQSIIKFNNNKTNTFHPTEKPVDLLEYLINTYTIAEETVMDNCMGSGSTGVACANLNRRFIGIEKDENMFKVAQDRLNKETFWENL